MQRPQSINKDDLIINPLPKLVKQYVNYIEVTTSDDLNDVVDKYYRTSSFDSRKC